MSLMQVLAQHLSDLNLLAATSNSSSGFKTLMQHCWNFTNDRCAVVKVQRLLLWSGLFKGRL